jgi:hypothetical protein
MRIFHEFMSKFLEEEDVTGKDNFTFCLLSIDLLSIVAYNENGDMTTVETSGGMRYILKIKYREFDALIRNTKVKFSES